MMEGLAAIVIGAGRWTARQARPRKSIVAVAGLPVVLVFALSTLLHTSGTRPDTRDVVDNRAAPVAATPAAVHLVTGSQPMARSDLGGGGAGRDVAPFKVPAPAATVWFRPKQDDRHLVCVTEPIIGQRCVDSPIQITK
jgi:hypothetical protein